VTDLGSRYEEALGYTARIHAGQTRRGGDVPYISHLLAVSALVIEDGGSEDEAIAALLHDAVEDQGGMKRLEDIRERYGDEVAYIVEKCSDSDGAEKGMWRGRKERYLAELREERSTAVHRVSVADKVHNLRSIVRDYRMNREHLWNIFSPGAQNAKAQLWYYRSLVLTYKAAGCEGPLYEELARLVSDLERLVERAALTAAPAA
jgi:(p)ppGpp synthase/HD superfamily hydrolase